ncbi:tyrosine/dopa decarboxylase, partial [Trifolium medium]|nr:tyrosine/dopa decarboxylase [Trifolium medium]
PLSPISALGLLNRFKTPLNDLKEKVVIIGIKEALSILKAGLTSKSALTNGLAHLLTEVTEEK